MDLPETNIALSKPTNTTDTTWWCVLAGHNRPRRATALTVTKGKVGAVAAMMLQYNVAATFDAFLTFLSLPDLWSTYIPDTSFF